MFCENCGKLVKGEPNVCPHCGAKLNIPKNEPDPVKVGVNIWTILSPSVGLLGWLYLVLFTGIEMVFTPVFAILSMVFGVLGYTTSKKKNQRLFAVGLFGFFVGMTLLMFSLYLLFSLGAFSFLFGGKR